MNNTKTQQQDNARLYGLVNDNAEVSALSAMRYGQFDTIASIADLLDSGDFYDPARGILYEGLHRVLMGVEAVSDETVFAAARAVAMERKFRGHITMEMVKGLPKEYANAEGHAITLKKLAWLRGAAGLSEQMLAKASMQPDVEEFYAWAQGEWQVLAPPRKDSGFVYGWDTVGLHREAIEKRLREASDPARVRFDWPLIATNKMLRPMRGGMVGLLIAPDGVGKSAILDAIAEWWAMKTHVVLVHLEDELEYKLDRRLAKYSGVPLDAIEDGVFTPCQLAAKEAAEDVISDAAFSANLHYYHAPDKSMTDVLRELQARVDEGVCDAVVFDYLQKVQPDQRQLRLYGSSKWERQADDMEQLKNFCEKNKTPAFAASQGNADIYNAGLEKGRENIYGSKQVVQKAQLVMIMTRKKAGVDGLTIDTPEGGLYIEPGALSPVVDIRVDKQNRGKLGDFHLYYHAEIFKFDDLEQHRIPL